MKFEEFLDRLTKEYPSASRAHDFSRLVIPTLVAPVALKLPRELWQDAGRIVGFAFRRLRNLQAERWRAISPTVEDPGHASVLMSYDFHLDADGRLRLIEVNTNASLSLLGDVMLCQRHIDRCHRDDFMRDFASELGRPLNGARVVIVDDNPASQKLYAEFLLYQEAFRSEGAECEIADRRALFFHEGKLWLKREGQSDFGPLDLVYNRLTDFYLTEPESQALASACQARSCVITPHPHEYRLLADKDRLVDWSQPEFVAQLTRDERELLQSFLLRTRAASSLSPEDLWSERKQLIFKPRRAFGGKSVYRGASISRGAFQNLLAQDVLVQDFVPAPTVQIDGVEFKFDLRFFAYRDQLRLAVARLYQGQMTNATTPGGGITSIEWVDDLSRVEVRTRD
jgi:hypothetical protein